MSIKKLEPVRGLLAEDNPGDVNPTQNASLAKPVDFDGFLDTVHRIEEFGLGLVNRPPVS